MSNVHVHAVALTLNFTLTVLYTVGAVTEPLLLVSGTYMYMLCTYIHVRTCIVYVCVYMYMYMYVVFVNEQMLIRGVEGEVVWLPCYLVVRGRRMRGRGEVVTVWRTPP